jgi:hypothetical protein
MNERSKPPVSVWMLALCTIVLLLGIGVQWNKSGYSFSLLMMAVLMLSSLSLIWQAAISKRPPPQSAPPKTWKVTLLAVVLVCCIGLVFIPDEYLPESVLNTFLGVAVPFAVCEQIASFLKMRRSIKTGVPIAEHTPEKN